MRINYGNYGMYRSMFGGGFGNSFYGSMGDYSSIRSGSYKKLLTSYYAKTRESQKVSQGGNNSTGTKTNSLYQDLWKASSSYSYTGRALNKVKEETDDLSGSAAALTAKGTRSLFNEVVTTTKDAETGVQTTTRGYNMDAITNAVKNFVSDYNTAVKAGSESSSANVKRNTEYMVRQTAIYEKSLAQAGITVGKDHSLSLDTDKLKSANIDTLKRIFNGNTSFAALTSSRSQSIGQAAVRAASSGTATYGRTGTYNMFQYPMSAWNWYL